MDKFSRITSCLKFFQSAAKNFKDKYFQGWINPQNTQKNLSLKICCPTVPTYSYICKKTIKLLLKHSDVQYCQYIDYRDIIFHIMIMI